MEFPPHDPTPYTNLPEARSMDVNEMLFSCAQNRYKVFIATVDVKLYLKNYRKVQVVG